jgi:hypothetical protein
MVWFWQNLRNLLSKAEYKKAIEALQNLCLVKSGFCALANWPKVTVAWWGPVMKKGKPDGFPFSTSTKQPKKIYRLKALLSNDKRLLLQAFKFSVL